MKMGDVLSEVNSSMELVCGGGGVVPGRGQQGSQ